MWCRSEADRKLIFAGRASVTSARPSSNETMYRLSFLLAALAFPAATALAQKTGQFSGANVRIQVGNVIVGYGRALKTSDGAVAAPEYRASGARGVQASRSVPARAKWTEVEVDGIPVSGTASSLMQWAQGVKTGHAQPQDVVLTLLKSDGTPAMRYVLTQAEPTRVTSSAMRAGSSSVEMIDVTFSAQGVTTSAAGAP